MNIVEQLTARNQDCPIIGQNLQALSLATGDLNSEKPFANNGNPALGDNAYRKIEYTRQRTISNLTTIRHELISKNLLVLGRIDVPFDWLVVECNMNVRRVFLTEYFTVDFVVEIFFAEGYRFHSTSFSKEAFQGDWDFVVAHQSPTSTNIGPIGLEILQRSMTRLTVKELILLSAMSF